MDCLARALKPPHPCPGAAQTASDTALAAAVARNAPPPGPPTTPAPAMPSSDSSIAPAPSLKPLMLARVAPTPVAPVPKPLMRVSLRRVADCPEAADQ